MAPAQSRAGVGNALCCNGGKRLAELDKLGQVFGDSNERVACVAVRGACWDQSSTDGLHQLQQSEQLLPVHCALVDFESNPVLSLRAVIVNMALSSTAGVGEGLVRPLTRNFHGNSQSSKSRNLNNLRDFRKQQ